jgi:hypothetical protein
MTVKTKGKVAKTETTKKETEPKDDKPTIGLVFRTQEQFAKLFTLSLSFDTRLRLKNIRTHVLPKLENFAETRTEIIQKYGESKDGKSWIMQPDNEEGQTELKNLYAVELKVSFDKIPESAFGDNLSILEVEALSWMIQEGV